MAIEGSEWTSGVVVPHLAVRNLDAALAFYESALDAELLYRSPASEEFGEYASLRIWNSIVMVSAELPNPPEQKPELDFVASPERLGGTTCVFQICVPHVDRVYKRAVDAGALPASPPADMFWGDRYGWIRDPFGHLWAFCSVNKVLSPRDVNLRIMRAT